MNLQEALFSGWSGCSNGDCVVRDNSKGMHTNASCKCHIYRDMDMIDRETAVQLAWREGMFLSVSDSKRLANLLNRTRDEAFERAAKICEKLAKQSDEADDSNGFSCAMSIRMLKTGGKK